MSALIAGCASTSTSATAIEPTPGATVLQAKSSTPIAADNATLGVLGMSCPKCANNIEKQLREVPGIADIHIDMGAGAVHLGFAGGMHPSPADLARAIERTGFTLAYISTP